MSSENCVSTNISTLPSARPSSQCGGKGSVHGRQRRYRDVDLAAPLGQLRHRLLEQHPACVEEPDIGCDAFDLAELELGHPNRQLAGLICSSP